MEPQNLIFKLLTDLIEFYDLFQRLVSIIFFSFLIKTNFVVKRIIPKPKNGNIVHEGNSGINEKFSGKL